MGQLHFPLGCRAPGSATQETAPNVEENTALLSQLPAPRPGNKPSARPGDKAAAGRGAGDSRAPLTDVAGSSGSGTPGPGGWRGLHRRRLARRGLLRRQRAGRAAPGGRGGAGPGGAA